MDHNSELKEVRELFHQELNALYEKREINHFFEWVCADLFRIDKTALLLNETVLSSQELAEMKGVIEKLKNQFPIQYILGNSNFMGLDFKVSSSVLIPRPETEELVALLLKDKPAGKLLDVGCGSGIIPICIKYNLPELEVHGIDISEEAIQISQYNANKNDVEVAFHLGDIFLENFPSMVDVIVSNPPYVLESEKADISTNVLQHEPAIALFVPDENPLLFYLRIIEMSEQILRKGGRIYFEIHENFGESIRNSLQMSGFEEIEIIKDLQGKDRFAKAIKKA
jgi:release factor glutamine methyltransferase